MINSCPAFPKPKKNTEKELQLACITQDTNQNMCPNLFEWLGRLHKYQLETEVK